MVAQNLKYLLKNDLQASCKCFQNMMGHKVGLSKASKQPALINTQILSWLPDKHKVTNGNFQETLEDKQS